MMMDDFLILEGTPGLRLTEVAHLMVPGRGRDASGRGLSRASLARVEHAATLHHALQPPGKIVCSGYRTPGDHHGGTWSPQASGETFTGVPEADSMRRELLIRGIADDTIEVERHSIDTVTNLARVEDEGHFGDGAPVAIVAQRSHLDRIIEIIAPRVMRRDFLGVVVPERGYHDVDGSLPRLASRMVLRGLTPDSADLVSITERRVTQLWRTASYFRTSTYHTD